MDKASAYGAGGCRLESCRGHSPNRPSQTFSSKYIMRQLLGSSPCGRASATLTQGSNGLASTPGGHELEFLWSSTEESGDEPAKARGAALRGAAPRGAVPRGAVPRGAAPRGASERSEEEVGTLQQAWF